MTLHPLISLEADQYPLKLTGKFESRFFNSYVVNAKHETQNTKTPKHQRLASPGAHPKTQIHLNMTDTDTLAVDRKDKVLNNMSTDEAIEFDALWPWPALDAPGSFRPPGAMPSLVEYYPQANRTFLGRLIIGDTPSSIPAPEISPGLDPMTP